jgi:adenylylsulfate reductase subunit A
MSTVPGLFMAGDICGASGHKFSSGSHAEGRIAAKAALAYLMDNPDYNPVPRKSAEEMAAELYLPFEVYGKFKDYSTDTAVNPEYIKPDMYQARLQKIADEYFGGISTWYMTSKTMLESGLAQLVMLKEDANRLAAADLHELMRCWENYHRVLSLEAHARHILFREETRYPGYYYRGDHDYIDDDNWKVFTCSKYDLDTGEFTMSKRDYVQVVSD